MELKELAFLVFASLSVLSALGVAFSRNIIHGAFYLLGALAGVAGLYVLAGADFLAGIQLLLYVGGTLVLIIFAVMLSSGIQERSGTNPSRNPLTAGFLALFLITALLTLVWNNEPALTSGMHRPVTRSLGNALLTEYLLPFEVISVLLLAGLVGAVALLRARHHKRNGGSL